MKIDVLIKICELYQLPTDYDVVIKEAYVPYIPTNWNGCLVLGEAQNLSGTYEDYVSELNRMKTREKITRLQNPNDLGIMPWDDGSLKIALKAALNIDPDTTAVSNAVLWSQTYNKTINKNPSKALEKHSSIIWDKMLNELNPSNIIASGAVARRVIEKTSWNKKNLNNIIHPNAIQYIKAELNVKVLLLKYPVVNKTVINHSDWIRGNKKLLIRFACHVYEQLVKNN